MHTPLNAKNSTPLIAISPRRLAHTFHVNPSTIYRMKDPEPIRLGGLTRWLIDDLLTFRLIDCEVQKRPWSYTIPHLANALDLSRATAYRLSKDPRLQRTKAHFFDKLGRMRTCYVVKSHHVLALLEEEREHRTPRSRAALEIWTLKE